MRTFTMEDHLLIKFNCEKQILNTQVQCTLGSVPAPWITKGQSKIVQPKQNLNGVLKLALNTLITWIELRQYIFVKTSLFNTFLTTKKYQTSREIQYKFTQNILFNNIVIAFYYIFTLTISLTVLQHTCLSIFYTHVQCSCTI